MFEVDSQNTLSVDVFTQDMSKWQMLKLKVLAVWEYSKTDVTYPLCFIGFMISEFGFILGFLYV